MNLNTVIATRPNKTIYRDGDNSIKVFNKDYSKDAALNEALNQARVEKTGLNVPEVHEVTKVDGCWAIVSEYIVGKTLTELMHENVAKNKEYLDLMIDLQIKVHSKTSPLLTKLRDKMREKIEATDFNSTIKYELQQRLDGTPRHNKLCHGDFRPSNIIVTPGGTPYIIDWSHVTQGNASADVARTYLLCLLAGLKDDAEYYLDRFCEKTNTQRSYAENWIPIVAASQSLKGDEKEKAFLSGMVDVAEYS